jgi:hypothetical protein
MKHRTITAAALGLVAGCTFTQHTHIAWLDPSYAPHSGQSAYSLMDQPLKTKVTVFRDGATPTRPYHAILIMAADGNGNQEPDAIASFIDLSRRAGANAVIISPPTSGLSVKREAAAVGTKSSTSSESTDSQAAASKLYVDEMSPNLRYLFKAIPIVWDSPTSSTTQSLTNLNNQLY